MVVGYLEEIVDDLWSGDVLCVCGKGLGSQVISRVLLKCLATEGGGVVVCLNVDGDREDGIISTLQAQSSFSTTRMPVFASAETHSRERRRKLYDEASRSAESPLVLCLASCRVAIVDMLDGTLDPRIVRGVVVNDAHRASEGSAEGFVIRAFRRANWTGWVRAFSDQAPLFVRGFAKVTKVMKELEVERLALWPRFEARVSASLDKIPVNVVELRRTPSAGLRRVQNAAIVALQSCLEELKQATAGLVFFGEDSSDKKDPFAACDAAVRAVHHQFGGSVSPKARVLAGELKSLRDLVEAVPRYDAVALYDLALSIRDSALKGGGRRPVSSWASRGFCLDELIVAARACVYEMSRDKTEIARVLEENPKWHLVAEAVRAQESGERVVVLGRDDYAAAGVADFLSLGGAATMEARFLRFLTRHNARAKNVPEARRSADQKLLLAEEVSLSERRESRPTEVSRGKNGVAAAVVIVATHEQWRTRDDALGEWVPDAVVLIDTEPEFVREVEAYQSRRRRSNKPVTLYVLACEDTADDAVYSVQLAAETEAFEKLVEERRLALVPSSESRVAQRRAAAEEEEEASKKKKSAKRATIIVDSREFRSQLPSALHAKNVDLEPATLVVGDYVLAPDLVVERKSLTDLASSLQSGRLYTQVEAMLRHYTIPVLLVETSASFFGASSSKPTTTTSADGGYDSKSGSWSQAQTPSAVFAFEDVDELPSVTSLEARFAIVALTYPRLRVVWCHDVNATVNIFAGLKRGRDQPSLQAALEKSSNAGEQDDGGGRNVAAIDLLLKLPGVNDKNVTQIIEQVENIKELATLDRQALTPIVGPSNAKLLFDFFHEVDDSVIPMPDHSPLEHTVVPGVSKKKKHRNLHSSSSNLSSSSGGDEEGRPKKRRAGHYRRE